MNKLQPKKAADNPLAASIMGAVLMKAGQANHSETQKQAGMDLLKVAEQNQDKMPKLNANSNMAKAIKLMKAKPIKE
jgi:hypothetical protein